jgi:hypothetical protein
MAGILHHFLLKKGAAGQNALRGKQFGQPRPDRGKFAQTGGTPALSRKDHWNSTDDMVFCSYICVSFSRPTNRFSGDAAPLGISLAR